MTAPREVFMAAAAASLQAMWPERYVLRGLQDPAGPAVGDKRLLQGVFCLIAGGTSEWAEYVGREAEYGKLEFAIVVWCKVLETTAPVGMEMDNAALRLEQFEAVLEHELLLWCQSIKTGPLLDAVYPQRVTYSGGIDCPVGWLVMTLQGGYV